MDYFSSSFFLEKYKYFIFDFDGIIKESVDAKRKAYCDLFVDFKFAIPKIEKHHIQYGGVSRYKKIPLYLEYCNLKPEPDLVDYYLKKFSENVTELILNSKWVPGIIDFLKQIKIKDNIFVVSATPSDEIKSIVSKIGIQVPKSNIYGSPISKIENISFFFNKKMKKDYIFFGDSVTDSFAAKNFSIDFAYRIYSLNFNTIPDYFTYIFNDFQNAINK